VAIYEGEKLLIMKRFIYIVAFVFLLNVASNAQEVDTTLTLKECISYALEHNINVQKQRYYIDNYKLDKTGSIASFFPSISANSGISANYGRSIDPATNTYTTVGNLGNNYSVSASMPLFAGFQYINSVKLANTLVIKGKKELSNIENELILKTMQLYFNAIYYNSTVNIGKEQLANSQLTLEQAKVLEELGKKSRADVAQIEAQTVTEELFLTKQQNLYNLTILELKQLINWHPDKNLNINDTIVNQLIPLYTDENGTSILTKQMVDEIILDALNLNPKIDMYRYNLKSKEYSLRIAQGKYLPSIYLSGAYGTNYYDNLSGGRSNSVGFWDQLKNNKGYGFGATLSIPIFNGLSKRVYVRQQKNNLKIANKELENAIIKVGAEVEKTAMEINGFIKESELAKSKVTAAQLAYEAVSEKFIHGSVNPMDLQTSANQLLTAKSELLNANLQLIVKCYLLEYYKTGNFFNE
jgi:Outer membrane protein